MDEARVGTGARGAETSAFRLLIVDDNELLTESLARCFARRGCSVRTATTAEGAELVTREEGFDCGIFDIHLGEDDGLILAWKLLHAGRVRAAVFFSAVVDAAVQHRASVLGTFVAKGASLEKLDRVIHELRVGKA